MEIFYVVTSNKSVVYLLLLIYKGICFFDLLTLFYERLIQIFLDFAGKQRLCIFVLAKWFIYLQTIASSYEKNLTRYS